MVKEKCDICKGKMGVCTARLQKCRWVIIQPGERLNGIQEVSGSIPLISTRTPENIKFSGVFLFQSGVFIVKISLFPNRGVTPRFALLYVPESYQNHDDSKESNTFK